VHLTSEQFEAAQTRGCQFQPASEAQIRQMAMQRRIFWLGEQAFTAQRSDGFFETAATLQKLLAGEAEAESPPAPAAPQPAAAGIAAIAATDSPPALAEPAAPAGGPEPATPPSHRPAPRLRNRPGAAQDLATPTQPVLTLVSGAEMAPQPGPAAVPHAGQAPAAAPPAAASPVAPPPVAPPPAAPPPAMPADEREVMQCVVTIVHGYARHNAMGAAELSALIANVHDTLAGLLHAPAATMPESAAAPPRLSRRRRGRAG
jgi:hypothetical protein